MYFAALLSILLLPSPQRRRRNNRDWYPLGSLAAAVVALSPVAGLHGADTRDSSAGGAEVSRKSESSRVVFTPDAVCGLGSGRTEAPVASAPQLLFACTEVAQALSQVCQAT